MYEIVRESALSVADAAKPVATGSRPIVVAMRENRSTLTREARGREIEIPLGRVRLRTAGSARWDLRPFVEARHTRIEIGRCLAPAERQEVAALLGDTFAQMQRQCRRVPLWA